VSWPTRLRSVLVGRPSGRRDVPYWRVSTFLPPHEADGVLRDLIERRAEFRPRGRNAAGRPTFYRMASPLVPSPEFLRRFQGITPILERRFGTNLEALQLELLPQAYNDGCAFARHRDAHAGGPNWRRRLSGIYYLHARPRRFEGGELALYDDQGDTHVLEPEHNSAVFFARDLMHEVLPVTCASHVFEDSRFAINVWMS